MSTAAKPPCDHALILAGASDGVSRSGRAVLATAILGSSMVFVDGTVVSVALPAMQVAFSATLGVLLTSIFNTALDRHLDRLGVPAVAREEIDSQRSRLASAQTSDSRARRAIEESFVAGYRAVVLVAAALAVASAVAAAVMIPERRNRS